MTLKEFLKNFELLQSFLKIIKIMQEFFIIPKIFYNFSTNNIPVIVSAATKSHELSLIRFIESLRIYEPDAIPIIFDMGISKNSRRLIIDKLKRFETFYFESFDFSCLPIWMNPQSKNNGAYAWKPHLLEKSMQIIAKRGLLNSIVIWMDSGNILTGDLKKIIKYTKSYGFWSTSSSGLLSQWTHKKSCERLEISNKELKSVNLNGAVIAFNLQSEKCKRFFSLWLSYAKKRDIISPFGATLKNHRFDQSILTLLAERFRISPREAVRTLSNGKILFHQDIESYAEIWLK